MMTSPLLAYANAKLLITTSSAPTIINGRVTIEPAQKYVIDCYLVRQQSSGTSTGGDYVPLQTSTGELLPGSSGVIYLYRGYALMYYEVSNTYELGDNITSSGVAIEEVPTWLQEGMICDHMQGKEQVKYCKIEQLSGKYGNSGIDEIINKEIGGIPIVVRSGDVVT